MNLPHLHLPHPHEKIDETIVEDADAAVTATTPMFPMKMDNGEDEVVATTTTLTIATDQEEDGVDRVGAVAAEPLTGSPKLGPAVLYSIQTAPSTALRGWPVDAKSNNRPKPCGSNSKNCKNKNCSNPKCGGAVPNCKP